MKKYILFFAFMPYLLFATETSIDMQISKIQNASPAQRVKLMNQFKQRLVEMNQADRLEAIAVMRKKMQASHTQSGGDKEHLQEHTVQMQMQNSEEMKGYQNMNQHQVADQLSRGEMNNMADGMKAMDGTVPVMRH